ncbi:MAG: rhodanese-like domain-containing protein [Pseudobutyrivibrio sp.]|nr:rhodanese-like domain-containing protein [Pseudobutyrivibrio sp.]
MGNVDEEVKEISAEEFARLDKTQITIVDAREPDEVLVHEIPGAINIPFSKIGSELKNVPKDKPVYVICRTGDLSGEIAELLAD